MIDCLQVQFHSLYPLMLSAGDDGSCHVIHAKVYDDLLQNPLVVPLKNLHVCQSSEDGGIIFKADERSNVACSHLVNKLE